MPPRRRILNLEALDDRILPSITLFPTQSPGHPTFAWLTQQRPHHSLQGQAHGTWSSPSATTSSDTGVTYQVNGTARLGIWGSFTVSGSVQAVGNVKSGHAEGQLTFTSSRGSFTIELTGPTQPGNSPLPQQYSYKTIGATGVYVGLPQSGRLTLSLGSQGSFSISF